MARVQAKCTQCGTTYPIDPSLLGKKAKCKRCGNTFILELDANEEPGSEGGTREATPSKSVARSARPSPPSAPVSRTPEQQRAGTARHPTERPASQDGVPEVWPVGETILNLYEVKSVLGEGGMGTVYRCRHIGWNVDLAVKSCKASMLTRRGAIDNFETEAETWVNLGLHPHIVSCYYVRRLGGLPRIFAEFVDGGSLKDWIDNGKLYEDGPDQSLERILDIAIQFAWGLHTAHEQGLVHQDVKPANVMLTSDGTAKVTDFGLAKARAMGGDGGRAAAGQSILVSAGGMTPAYCSPEQANGLPLTRKTDIWSWAVSVLEMFTGEVGWPSGSVAREALEGYLEDGADDERIPTMPTEVANLLRRCLDPRPENRPANMAEVGSALVATFQQSTGRPYDRPEPQRSRLLADGLNNQALSLCDLGKQQEAESLLERALEVDPHHPEATYNRGLLKWRTGRIAPEALIAQLNEVATSRGRDARLLHLLGLVHIEYGDSVSAVKTLEESLKRTPEHQPTMHALRTAREGESKWGSVRWSADVASHYRDLSVVPNGGAGLAVNLMGGVDVWDVREGKLLTSLKSPDAAGILCIAVSPDGRVAVSGSVDGFLHLWDLSKNKCVKKWKGSESGIYAIAYSPDGRQVLSCENGGGFKLWDVPGGACRRSFGTGLFGKVNGVGMVAWSPDGRFASILQYNNFALWDLHRGEKVRRVFGVVHASTFNQVAFSHDGRLAVSAHVDSTVRVWDVSTGKCLQALHGSTGSAAGVAISRNGKWITSCSEKMVRLWNLETGRCVRTFQVEKHLLFVHFLPGDRQVLCCGHGMALLELGIGSHQEFAICRPEAAESLNRQAREAIRLKEQAEQALRAGDPSKAYGLVTQTLALPGHSRSPELLALHDRAGRFGRITGLRAGWHAHSLEGHTSLVEGVVVSSDARRIASSSWDGTVRVWDSSDGRCLQVITSLNSLDWKGRDGGIALSPDGQSLAVGCHFSELLRMWQVTSGDCVLAIPTPKDEAVRDVRISPDHRRSLSVTVTKMPIGNPQVYRYRLRLWNLPSGHCLFEYESQDEMTSTAFSGDGRRILVGGRLGLMLFDASTGRKLATFQGSQFLARSVNLSSDGTLAILGAMALQGPASIEVWNLRTGTCVQRLSGHTGHVNSLRISPDGRHAVSGGADKTVRLWDLRTGVCLRIFEGHTAGVGCVAFSPDGQFLVSGSDDSHGNDFAIRVWRLVWNYEFPPVADWDDEARSHLENFLVLHTPYALDLQAGAQPNKEQLTQALQRAGRPQFTETDVQRLLDQLASSGFGWLRPDGVRRQLEKMVAAWQGLPPLAALPMSEEPRGGESAQSATTTRAFREKASLKWLPLGVGILIMAIGIAWTCYLVRDGFRWWSLATAFLTVIGLGQSSVGAERFGNSFRDLLVSFVMALGFSAWTIYLFAAGRTYWCFVTGPVALFGILATYGAWKNHRANLGN